MFLKICRNTGRGARFLVHYRSRSCGLISFEGCFARMSVSNARGAESVARPFYSSKAAWTPQISSHDSADISHCNNDKLAKRFPVQVGALLRIDMPGTAARINVTVGECLEEVVLQPNWIKMDDSGLGWESLEITSLHNQVTVKQIDRKSPGSTPPGFVEVNAKMPEQWCSLDIKAGKGSVYVENVKEGSLDVQTKGGDVKLGNMKGSVASINSGGGDIEVNVVQAQSSFRTGGGKLRVKRLQGPSIAVESWGGDVVLGSLYGDNVRVETRGGSVEAKEIQGQERALISTNGGIVLIDGIDGKATINSDGGNIEVQLNEHAQEVTIDAGKEGRVVLCLSARLTALLKYEGTQGVVQEGTILTSGSEFGVYVFNGKEAVGTMQMKNSGWRGSENYLPGGVTACQIFVLSAGQVYVKQRSWLELVMGRVS